MCFLLAGNSCCYAEGSVERKRRHWRRCRFWRVFKEGFSVVVGVGLQFDCEILCRVWNGLAFEDCVRGDVVDERVVVPLWCCPRGVGKEEILANQAAGFSVNFVFERVQTCKEGKLVVVQPLRARQVGGLGRCVGEGFCGRLGAEICFVCDNEKFRSQFQSETVFQIWGQCDGNLK